MNIHQSSPRTDCIHFAKCGKHSVAFCRRYGAVECHECKLVKRKPNQQVIIKGEERKRCTCCHKILPLHRFYDRIVRHGDKEYKYKSSWCKQCTANDNLNRSHGKNINKISRGVCKETMHIPRK